MKLQSWGVASILLAHAALASSDSALMTPAGELVWKQQGGPPFAQAWQGDDGSHGQFFRFPPGFASPLHFHTHDYHGIVVQGVMDNPMGQAQDAVDLPSGSAYFVPGKEIHRTRCISKTPCLLYLHQTSAFDLIVVKDPDRS